MSRCFPFPPPGYEKRSRSGEQGDLLAKEKHKEKKHKKEKKDKEKRDSKERKEKDRSKDKHKEKKDEKEKHKDKKKDKVKSRTSEDQRSENPSEVLREVMPGYDTRKSEEIKDSKFTEEFGRRIRDEEQGATNRMPEEFTAPSQRKSTEGLHSSAAVAKESISSIKLVTPSVQKRGEGMGTAIAMEKQKAASKDMVPSFYSTEQKRNESFTPPLQKRNESMGTPTALDKQRVASDPKVGDVKSIEQRKNHVTSKPVDNFARSGQRGNEGFFHANPLQKERGAYNNMVPNTTDASTKRSDGTSSVLRRNEGMGVVPPREVQKVAHQNTVYSEQRTHRMGQADKDTNKKADGKEKTEGKKAKDGNGEGLKDRDRKEKKRKEKDKDRHKKEKEKEKKRVKDEVKHVEQDKPRKSGSEKKDQIQMDGLHSKPLAPYPTVVKPPVADGNSRKRKELEMNGFLHEPQSDWRPNKLLKTDASSSNPPAENGTALEFNHISSPVSSVIFEVINDTRAEQSLDNSDKRHMNGKAEVYPPLLSARPPNAIDPSVSLRPANAVDPSVLLGSPNAVELSVSLRPPNAFNPSVTLRHPNAVNPSVTLKPPNAVNLSKSVQMPLRPPHPDSKYLSTIYSVPKIEEWLDNDDQDWLFNSEYPRPKTKLEADVSPPQVWAQGTHIDADDVFALPYVIPF